MKYKFIYCNDEKLKDELITKLDFINESIILGEKVWIFENKNTLNFSKQDLNKIKFTNKLFL